MPESQTYKEGEMFVQIKKVLVLLVCAIFVLTMAAMAMAAEVNKPPTPTELKGGKIISVKEAKELFDKKETKFFDMRSPLNYGKGHIPGAVSLPYKEKSDYTPNFDASKDEFDLSKVPQDKNARIVFHSDGPNGWKSYKASVLAIKAGYKNIMWFRGGTDDWEKAGYPIEK